MSCSATVEGPMLQKDSPGAYSSPSWQFGKNCTGWTCIFFRYGRRGHFRNNGRVIPKLTGINRASTFTGFCTIHDDSIFAPIEKRLFMASPEQCFLVAYRSLSMELFLKNAALTTNALSRQSDRGTSPLIQQEIQHVVSLYERGLKLGLNDSQYHKGVCDELLVQGSFEETRAYVIEFDRPIPIVSSGGVLPEAGFDGNSLQDLGLSGRPADFIACNSFINGDRGCVVFSWLQHSDHSCVPFIESLAEISNGALADCLVRFLFEFCENIHMAPDWWESLPRKHRSH